MICVDGPPIAIVFFGIWLGGKRLGGKWQEANVRGQTAGGILANLGQILGGKCLGGKRREANDGGQTAGEILTVRVLGVVKNQKIITQTVIICMFKIHLFLSITPIQIDTIPHSAEEYI